MGDFLKKAYDDAERAKAEMICVAPKNYKCTSRNHKTCAACKYCKAEEKQ